MASLTTIRSLPGRLASRARWERTRLSKQSAVAAIESVLRTDLTYLDRDALLDLHESVARIEKDEVPGILLEAGTARGGSALVIAAAKSSARPLYLYDTFGLIPPPSERDGATS